VNDESIANPTTQLREEFCSEDERNPSKNFEQAREVESIENVLTDNQIGFSYESLYNCPRPSWKKIGCWVKVNVHILLTLALIST
jgi:hypothetical protein